MARFVGHGRAADRDGERANLRTRREVVVKCLATLAPIAHIGFVTDGEVEQGMAVADRVHHHLHQMCSAWTEPCDLGIVGVTREQVIIAAARHKAEIDRGGMLADVQPADVRDRRTADRTIELRVSRSGKQIANSHASKRFCLLLHQGVD